jgi:copper chaperone CopZ
MHLVTTHVTLPIPGNRLDAPRAQDLTRTLEAVPGVTSVFIGLQTEMAFIVYDPKQVDLMTLKTLIGWKASHHMNRYKTLLESIPQAIAEHLIRCAHTRRVQSGEVIADLGEPIVTMVMNGWFHLSRFDHQGGQYLVSLRREGRFIWLESAVGANVPASEVIAFGPGTLMIWPAEEFAALAHSNTVLAIATARAMAEINDEEFNARHLTKQLALGHASLS